MRQRIILIVLIGLNVALAAALISDRLSSKSKSPAPSEDVASAASTNAGKTHVVVRRQFFSWREVESPDYRAYIANLRDIGCPEATIRDIIVADVNQLYAKKRLTDIITADQQWWRSDPDPALNPSIAAKSQALDQQQRELLATLLGPNWDLSETNLLARSVVALNGPVLGDLSIETRQAVQDISNRSQQRATQLMEAARAEGRTLSAAELTASRQQTREELAKVLNPAQMEEFLLRYSQNASTLRNDLRGFDVSPDEFRNIFRAIDPLDQQIQLNYAGDDPASVQQRAILQKQRDDALKNALGADRYAQLQLAKDPAYHNAFTAAQQAGAPATTVQAVYQINQYATQEQQRIQNDSTLTDEQKAAQLAAVAQQQKNASDQVLGLAPPTPPPTPPLPPGLIPGQTHAYRPGETLDQIATQYGTTAGAIQAANPNMNPNVLQRNQAINIPPRSSVQ
jgi:LysM repeat protein